ncbi:MAG: hypothetical protein ACXWUG_06820 [Polyangiales bacterium]
MLLDQRGTPELYVDQLLARFREEEPTRLDDLQAFADAFGGQLEDAAIELLGLSPDEALDALLAWRARAEGAGTSVQIARRRLDTMRKLVALAEREFTDTSVIAFVKERHGSTLAELLADSLRVDAPS